MTTTMSTPVPPLDWPHYGIGFVAAVKRVFQKYATFSGRASRERVLVVGPRQSVIGRSPCCYALILALRLRGGPPR